MSYFIYILECTNGAYYTGYTTDVRRRFQEHQQGSCKCKYTRSFPPKHLAACWCVDCELSMALRIECIIKGLARPLKNNLIKHPHLLNSLLLKKGYEINFLISIPKDLSSFIDTR